MKATRHNIEMINSTNILLELTREEATWLHSLVQNPVRLQDALSTESPYDAAMRKKFFNATDPTLW